MTTTETPTDNSTPGAPDPAAIVEPSHAPAAVERAEPGTNGEAPAAAAPSAEHADDHATSDAEHEGGEGDEHDAAAGDASGAQAGPAGATGEKKKRRRRRKKKTADGTAEARPEGSASGEEAPVEGTAAEAGDEHAAPKRDKKKEKKHGPPRERPPVNAGDIVFGKIIDITPEAIIIDIPGKAKAIFDRRELLLPEEDEAPPPRARAAEDADETSEGAETADASAASPAEATEGTTAVEIAPEAETTPEAAPAAEPAPAAETVDASAEAAPPREPKVPRVTLEVGADFIAVVHNDGARGGMVVLTHHPHRAERAKPMVEKAFNDKTVIEGLVTGVIKGGVEVDIDGLRAFCPGSHIDMRLGADLNYLLAERLPFLVTQYAKRGRDLVLSRKTMMEEEAKKARTEALARLKIGEEVEGTVRSVVSFGAFVDVGGIEGLVPLQEMSHNRGDGPSDVFKAGEPTRVKVTKIDERGKVWLSHKATIPDPWQKVAEKYAAGTKHSGKVARLQPFGAFVELESGIDGLIHLADLSINRIESPGDVVKVGDPIEVVVSHVDPSNHKIALHPAPTGDAANETPQRVQPHKPVKCKVVLIESGGLVVRILGVTGRNSRGYITSAGTGTPRGTELRKAFKVGQELDAKVIEMDPRRGEVKLSIKALSEEQERSAYQQYRQQLKAEARFTFADLLTKKGPPPQR
ncbi:MAG: S1 RNA-binding domain-containing protein [Polyangiaceae bacterium]|jgi:small subunit ribosomal protein S1